MHNKVAIGSISAGQMLDGVLTVELDYKKMVVARIWSVVDVVLTSVGHVWVKKELARAAAYHTVHALRNPFALP